MAQDADPGTSRLRANIARIASGGAASQLLLFAATPLLTRLYAPETFGVYAVYAGLHAIVAGLFTLKYDAAVVLPSDDRVARRLTVLTMALSVALSGLTGLGLLVWWRAAGRPPPWQYVGLPFGAVTAAALTVAQQWAARANDYRDFARSQVVGALVNVAVAVGAGALWQGPVPGLLAAFVLGQAASVVFMVARKPPDWTLPSRAELQQVARDFVNFPMHVLPSRLVLSVGAGIQPTALERLFSLDDVGQYALANRMLLTPSALIGGAISEAFRAELVTRLRERRANEAFTLGVLWRTAAIASALVGALVLVGPTVFGLVFGDRYAAAGDVARYLAPAALAQFIAMPLNHVLIAHGNTRLELLVQLFANLAPLTVLVGAALLGLGFAGTLLCWSGAVVGALGVTFLVARRVLRSADRGAEVQP
ncbi:MAG: oligosaccharide flippase family protein [Deltaproteobacteria bacterium]|nr:oligosaccharide flippase family protein [Deltaproteobacteria bacterium]